MTHLRADDGTLYEVVAPVSSGMPDDYLIVRLKPAGGEDGVLLQMFLDARYRTGEVSLPQFEAAIAAERERVARIAQEDYRERSNLAHRPTVASWANIEARTR